MFELRFPPDRGIPNEYLEDCKRICNILKEQNVRVIMPEAYRMWKEYSITYDAEVCYWRQLPEDDQEIFNALVKVKE